MRVDLNPVFIRKDTEGFRTFIVGGMGSVPGQETKIPHAMWLKKKRRERQTRAKRLCKEGGRDWNDATASQGISKIVGDHQKPGKVS